MCIIVGFIFNRTGVHATYIESATTPIWVDLMWLFLCVRIFMDHAPALWGKLFS
jgi:hypothetical protein